MRRSASTSLTHTCKPCLRTTSLSTRFLSARHGTAIDRPHSHAADVQTQVYLPKTCRCAQTGACQARASNAQSSCHAGKVVDPRRGEVQHRQRGHCRAAGIGDTKPSPCERCCFCDACSAPGARRDRSTANTGANYTSARCTGATFTTRDGRLRHPSRACANRRASGRRARGRRRGA